MPNLATTPQPGADMTPRHVGKTPGLMNVPARVSSLKITTLRSTMPYSCDRTNGPREGALMPSDKLNPTRNQEDSRTPELSSSGRKPSSRRLSATPTNVRLLRASRLYLLCRPNAHKENNSI